jgi:hypothetical protein
LKTDHPYAATSRRHLRIVGCSLWSMLSRYDQPFLVKSYLAPTGRHHAAFRHCPTHNAKPDHDRDEV